jgi:glycosyltransferase involved in cell wall biosynthesis
MNPDVTIVLVAYNRATFLQRTLDCIVKQTYPNFELLICDDCSIDNTPEVARRYAAMDQRIQHVRNPVNLGMPGNLNAGIKRANCDLIAILHDGDIYHPELIEKWRAALLEHPNAGFVFNVYRHLAPDGVTGALTSVFPDVIPGKEFLENGCFADPEMECPVWGTVMTRHSIVRELGYFDPRYGFWSDMDMWFRIAERYDVAFVPEPLIDIPSRNAMPHLFSASSVKTHATIFRMYWAARCRMYKTRPVRLLKALTDQVAGFTYTKSRRAIRRLRKT